MIADVINITLSCKRKLQNPERASALICIALGIFPQEGRDYMTRLERGEQVTKSLLDTGDSTCKLLRLVEKQGIKVTITHSRQREFIGKF